MPLTYRKPTVFGFCLAFAAQLSWWRIVLRIIPAKAKSLGSPFGGENPDTGICIYISLYISLPHFPCL